MQKPKVKRWEKAFYANVENQRKVGVAIVKPDKVAFKIKSRDKKHFVMKNPTRGCNI